MKITDCLVEKKEHECKTPDAIYHTKIRDGKVTVSVDLPSNVSIPDSSKLAKKLEDDLHLAVEKVLKRLF